MKTYNCTPEHIETLAPNEIFVFGSNLAGRHGKGAAKQAMKFGAIYGIGHGLMGQTYAIPTKDRALNVLPLNQIAGHIGNFLYEVRARRGFDYRSWIYLVTPIGCGLAGYTPKDIAPMFYGAPENVILPQLFQHEIRLLH